MNHPGDAQKSKKAATKSGNWGATVDKDERLKTFRENLLKITQAGRFGNFVIFEETTTKRFVQFAGEKGRGNVLCNIPIGGLNKLSENETYKLVKVGFPKTGGKFETCQKSMEVEEAVELTEKIFRDVFNFPLDYEIRVTLNLE